MVGSERVQAASPRAAGSADRHLLAGFVGTPAGPHPPAATAATSVIDGGPTGPSLRRADDPDGGAA